MWTLRLLALFSYLLLARGDIEAYNELKFDELTEKGKHFIQFWQPTCQNSLIMMN